MKRHFIFLLIIVTPFFSKSQETEMESEELQMWEMLAANGENEAPEDQDITELERFKKHPLQLNKVGAEELKELNLLTVLQIDNLIRYRKLFGDLLHVYELQAIPGWDVRTIRRVLHYVTINEPPLMRSLKSFKEDEQGVIIRYGKRLEPSKGFLDKTYRGSSDKFSIRYRYNHHNLLRWGIAADKDAGETFLGRQGRTGFDFYTFHIFLRKPGVIQSLAIGDFTVNMAQGLIHWQSLAFKKSATVINIKRQSAVLRPYTATGEFNFLRGAGITLKKNRISLTLFSSYRKLSGHLEKDTGLGSTTITSFITSGTHRTTNEIKNRNNINQFSSGAVCQWTSADLQITVNTIYHQYPFPVAKKVEPYNSYALKGISFLNSSMGYSYTIRNLHVFGEIATDKNLAMATVQGFLLSLDRQIDVAILFRGIGRRYQAVNGNAFTESTLPNNEEGLYSAISIRPIPSVSIDAYLDLFRFPWIKYRVNAPSQGKDFLLTVNFKPNKQVDCYARIKADFKWRNQSGSGQAIDPLESQQKQNLRLHADIKVSKVFTFKSRLEFTAYEEGNNEKQGGCMMFADFSYRRSFSRWSAHARAQVFNIDSYDVRIYAYESRNPGVFSIPSVYGNGKKYLVHVNYQLSSPKKTGWKCQASIAWLQTFYKPGQAIGTGADMVAGNRRSEINVQLSMNKN